MLAQHTPAMPAVCADVLPSDGAHAGQGWAVECHPFNMTVVRMPPYHAPEKCWCNKSLPEWKSRSRSQFNDFFCSEHRMGTLPSQYRYLPVRRIPSLCPSQPWTHGQRSAGSTLWTSHAICPRHSSDVIGSKQRILSLLKPVSTILLQLDRRAPRLPSRRFDTRGRRLHSREEATTGSSCWTMTPSSRSTVCVSNRLGSPLG
jgi:hypothetical protein